MAARDTLPSVFFEMLQSFTALGQTLNLSRAVEQIGVTRQTIRRHVNDLEELKNEKLFELQDRKYTLTPAGKIAMIEADQLLGKAANWLSNHSTFVDGLPCAKLYLENELPFFAQRHRLNKVWSMAPPLIREGVDAWISARARIEDEALKPIRPYLVIYRKLRTDWICVEVGERSSYATWLGSTWAKSAVGLSFHEDPIKSEADRFMIEAYDTVAHTGGAWYDHISTKLLRSEDGTPTPVNYQRLVLSCLFPDGEPAVAALIARTNRISIDGILPHEIADMPEADLMEFEL